MNSSQLIDIVDVVCHSFRHLNPRLMNHGERVAYILMKMLEGTNYYTKQEKQDIFMLGLLHDIGAYKEDEIDAMLSFDREDSMEHSVFGYLLFQNFSPLSEYADIILYHHHCDAQYYPVPIGNYHRDIARLVYLADRIDIFCILQGGEGLDSFLDKYADNIFSSAGIRWFHAANKKYNVLECIRNGTYQEEFSKYTRESIALTEEQIHKYLIMFVFSMDFRNECTALHTSYAVHLSENFANTLHLSPTACQTIQLAAMLHNIGTAAIPANLSSTDGYECSLKEIYQNSTLDVTRKILSGAVDPQIIKVIEDSFQILKCWIEQEPVPFRPTPTTEIVALSYFISNILSNDPDLSHHPKMVRFLKGKYLSCNMDNTILAALENYFQPILEQTQASCASASRAYHHVMDEYHYLNTILIHYNTKYKW